MSESIVFFDLEVIPGHQKIADFGAINERNGFVHSNSLKDFKAFLPKNGFLCGHNIIQHDLKYLNQADPNFEIENYSIIDTLHLSPLLFPANPYHRLIKNDKLQTDELNNPLNDAKASRELFYDEVNAFNALPDSIKQIYATLLSGQIEFAGFFQYMEMVADYNQSGIIDVINSEFEGLICASALTADFIEKHPIAFCYCLAIVSVADLRSISPAWVLNNYPEVNSLIQQLRNTPCDGVCTYCDGSFNAIDGLKRYFGYEAFRKFDGIDLQQEAVTAAIKNESLMVVFPTGGGKSLTFQVPALMAGEATRGLTVIISPLQSLMKDQVDNLESRGITAAVTINGLLDPIERSKSFERIESGTASVLYISPESLRSKSIERLILSRTVVRFVIDEAHCFSSWGHDFRVDYLYIGDFIRNIQLKKHLKNPIPVSCFTATARKKVIADIRQYFREKLKLELRLFKASSSRTNLHYKVFPGKDPDEKYEKVRELLDIHQCPTIIYVSRTKTTHQLSERLNSDGFVARPFHGKLDSKVKTENQNAFIKGEVDIIIATSAFGMGVDKGDVGVVIHFDISNSLENYVQEAGRAGRDQTMLADCYILFNEEDLNKHFLLHNQTKLSIKEIQQVWRAIKEFTRYNPSVTQSALEIARKAGWDDQVPEIETRVTTAIAALEDAGYLERGQNIPRIYASSILTNNANDAILKINQSNLFNSGQKVDAIRIIRKLFSAKSKNTATEDEAESRIDYLSDRLGIKKGDVLKSVALLREAGILSDHKDLSAFIQKKEGAYKSLKLLESFAQIERFLMEQIGEEETQINIKEINELAKEAGLKSPGSQKIKLLLNFWSIKNIAKRKVHNYSKNHFSVKLSEAKSTLVEKQRKRHELSKVALEKLFAKIHKESDLSQEEILVEFSVMEIKKSFEQSSGLFSRSASVEEVEDTLFYLSKIGAIKIEGGFLIVYNRLTVNRLEKNNKIQYKGEDYQNLETHYQNKVKQIHIVGEYAKKMMTNNGAALRFADDYFQMDYHNFESKYFPGRQHSLKRNMTDEKFKKLFGLLSEEQHAIIDDDQSPKSVVVAGPGSGKTMVLVHKLASILMLEDVKHEQLLMLTFSRAAATEFKMRLIELVGNIALRVEIKTFHAYCFDLLDKRGTIDKSSNVIADAVEGIETKTIEFSKITKSVLVIDEAQDMTKDEFALVKTLMRVNDGIRIIAVGDDDQNIYGFRGSDNQYFRDFALGEASKQYELLTNYRSKKNIVDFNNQFLTTIDQRMKSASLIPNISEAGQLKIVSYQSNNLAVPLVEDLLSSKPTGTSAILTLRNEDVQQIAWLLKKRGVHPKIVQSDEGFSLFDLYELRTFLQNLGNRSKSPVIDKDQWNNAKIKFAQKFKTSSNYELCKEILSNFQRVNPLVKYWSDLEIYIRESKIEDFMSGAEGKVYVSTIHKAKGKEFDNVSIMLEGFHPKNDEDKRLLYVAMTRAKSNLFVHYNSTFLNHIIAGNMQLSIEKGTFAKANHISIQLGHKDVNLGYFKFIQHRITSMISGQQLRINKEGLCNQKDELVLKFSEAFCKKLSIMCEKQYKLTEANLNFIVYWKGKNDDDQEVKILLPTLIFEKNG